MIIFYFPTIIVCLTQCLSGFNIDVNSVNAGYLGSLRVILQDLTTLNSQSVR